jgi:2-polyprenyl-3-methyl-5-hydroxy-6-metoxy-1,4-benzoquinol methylase
MILASRSRALEIMDGADFTCEELSRNLLDLERYSRITGGTALVVSSLASLARGFAAGRHVSILEIGAGSAGVARQVAGWASRRGWRPTLVAADLNPRMILEASRRNRSDPSIKLCLADARALPHEDGAFDLAYCSLVLHHLDEPEIENMLAELRRVTRIGFVIADLRRSALAYASVWALTRLTSRNRLTLNDGPLSVRRALTPGEMRAAALRVLGGAGGAAGTRGNPAGRLIVRRNGPARMVLTYRHAREGAAS